MSDVVKKVEVQEEAMTQLCQLFEKMSSRIESLEKRIETCEMHVSEENPREAGVSEDIMNHLTETVTRIDMLSKDSREAKLLVSKNKDDLANIKAELHQVKQQLSSLQASKSPLIRLNPYQPILKKVAVSKKL